MFREKNLLFLHAITSVHAGSGSELGLVDLTIQREKHTGFPKIESSSLKGAVRSTVEDALNLNNKEEENRWIETIFGKEGEKDQNNAQAGSISFSDARILLFPVKSLKGVFAWITCPYIIQRFNNEMTLYELNNNLLPVPEANTISGSDIIVSSANEHTQVILEEYTYTVTPDDTCKELADKLQAWAFPQLQNNLAGRLMVIADDDFRDFVTLSTEVNARIAINKETGTVDKDKGALWYEENVPPEALFYTLIFAGDSRGKANTKAEDIVTFLQKEEVFPQVFQLGGNSTLGRGMLRRIWA